MVSNAQIRNATDASSTDTSQPTARIRAYLVESAIAATTQIRGALRRRLMMEEEEEEAQQEAQTKGEVEQIEEEVEVDRMVEGEEEEDLVEEEVEALVSP